MKEEMKRNKRNKEKDSPSSVEGNVVWLSTKLGEAGGQED
jgi:hypothetical protein